MGGESPDRKRNRLQDLLLVADSDRRTLYWRQIDENGASLEDADADTIQPRCRLRFDTLVNSFYERYWRDLTGVETLELVVETSGPCRARVVRRVAGQPETTLADVVAHGAHTRSSLSISLSNLSANDAVIFAEVEAFEQAVHLHEGAWVTDTSVRHEVRLAIVICSFGREDMLVENLRRMAPIIARTKEISSLLIVRQGGRDLAAFGPYRDLSVTGLFVDKLRLIRQGNFGGTGGFVRGVLESLDADATHVLLLDDDVRLEAAVLERLTALASYLTSPTTIGGQMLDLDRPTMLHASHETVEFRNLRLHNPCRDIDMGVPRTIDVFGRRHRSDYNAWWLCCIPAATFREVGLPMPMFIRHDDLEYGVRTVASGAALVTMPGIFVWHAPFTFKNVTPSFVYYERRNFMIAAALHSKASPIRLMWRHWRDAWTGLRKHRYEYCWASCRAVDDFLAGPRVVFSNIKERHGWLAKDQARFTLLTMTNIRHRAENRRRTRLARALLSPPWTRNRAEAQFASIIRHLAFAIIRTSVALLWRGRGAAATYRAEAATYTSPAFWRDLLALSPESGASS